MEPKRGSGLTGLLMLMRQADVARIKAMKIEETARYFGADPAHVAGYKAMELHMRGVR